MPWKPVDIDDKDEIDRFLRHKDSYVSDLSFTNLYLWHFSRSISYKIVEGFLCIKTQYPNEHPFVFMPLGSGDLKSVLLKLEQEFCSKSIPFSLRAVDSSMKSKLEEILPSYFDFSLQRDRFDYIYLIDELIELKGRKFHKKKNHLNRFKETYPYSFEKIDGDNVEELILTYKEWFGKISDSASIGLKNEYIAIIEALKNFKKLNIVGGVIRVFNKIVAFSFGEAIAKDMVVIHIEKADISFSGAYQAINMEFLNHCFREYKYVNREEDLGIEGLRRAKLSYQPYMLLEKYEAKKICF